MTVIGRNLALSTGTFVSLSPVVKSGVLAAVSSVVVQAVSQGDAYNTNAIYSGVFDVASIFTGFLATFYTFVVTKGNDFLRRIKDTNVFRGVLVLLKFTILWAILVVAFSYAMMVFDPKGFVLFGMIHAIVFFWLFNVFMVIVNFTRCVVQFMIIAETDN